MVHKKKRRIKDYEKKKKLVGKMSDGAIARHFGVSANVIHKLRTDLGIAPFKPNNKQKKHQWLKRDLAKLGKMYDRVLAKRLGLATMTVCTKRNNLGIKAYGRWQYYERS